VVAGRTLLLSRQGTQQGDSLGMLLFALAIQPLILRVQSACDLELKLWYAEDGTLVGSIAEVVKAYQILKEDEPKYCSSTVPHKTSLCLRTMDCVRMRLFFDCRLDIDDNDLPLPGIVRLGSPVGSDNFVKQHLIAKSTKVDVVLGMIADMDNAQIAMPLLRSCLSIVLFTSVFGERRRSKRSLWQLCWKSSNAFESTACYPIYLRSRWWSCARRPCRSRTVDSGTPFRPTSSSLYALGPHFKVPMPS
jgi:hypothetical protein